MYIAHDGRRLVLLQLGECGEPVLDGGDRQTGPLERAGEAFSDTGVVIDYEHVYEYVHDFLIAQVNERFPIGGIGYWPGECTPAGLLRCRGCS